MKKMKPRFKLLSLLTIAMAVLVLTGCPVAPPTEPMDQYKPYLSPESVRTLKATNGYEDSITLSWDAVPDATSYQVWKVDAADYGAVSNPVMGDSSYYKLKARGFELLGITEDTSFKMSDCKHNEAYVFTVIAMRSVGPDSNKSILFSDIGNFVEGSTIGDIAFTAVSLADEIILSWQVNNLYDVLYTRADSSSAEKKPLFDNYEFQVSYRSEDSSYMPITSYGEGAKDEMRRINILDNGLRLNTKYYFKVSMSVFEGSSEIGHVESFEFPVYTTSKFSISPIDSVTVSEGSRIDAVDVTWKTPSVPNGIDYRNIFEVQRAVVSESGIESDWSTVLSVEQYKAHESDIATAEGNVYTWSDTSVAENTLYRYRVLNGYIINDVDTLQDAKKPITTSANSGYSLWRPTEIAGKFVKATGENPDNGTLTITWKLDKPQKNTAWVLSETRWYEKDYSTVTAPAEGAVFTPDGSLNTCTYNVKVTDLENLSVFTYELAYKYGEDTLVFKVPTDVKVSLGKSTTKVLFTDLSASNDLVGKIRLQWKLDPKATDDLLEGDACPYVLWENDVEKAIDYNSIVKGADGLRSYEIEASALNSYRLKLRGSYDGGAPSDYASPDAVTGNVLAVPAELSATDSTSRDAITVTWKNPENAAVRYDLEYSEKGTDSWTALPVDTASGTISISKETIGAEKAGAIYEFRMKASNTADPGSFTAWTPCEEGSIFGTYGMNLEVVNNGLDPDNVNLRWNPVVGAGFYKVVRDGLGFSGNGTAEAFYADSKIVGIKWDESNRFPLSKEYEYKVIPYMTREEADEDTSFAMPGSDAVNGKLFAPPVGIKATKGEFTKEIHVTWDPIEIPGEEISYEVFKYLSADIDPSKDKPIAAAGNEFVDKVATEGIYYAVRTVRKTPDGDVKSHWQTNFDDAVNEVGVKEPANYGYRLNMPSNDFFTVNEIIDSEKYGDYIILKWKRVPGASGYRVYNSLLGDDGFDIPLTEKVEGTGEIKSIFTDNTETTLTNGKKPDEVGYLAYDKASEIFTYNDASGVIRRNAAISSYGLAAKNGTQVSGRATEGTTVHRQLRPEEVVNLVNYGINEVLHNADTKFGGDWFQYGTTALTYEERGAYVEIPRTIFTGIYHGHMKLDKFVRVDGTFELTSTSNMATRHNGGVAASDNILNFLQDGVIKLKIKLPDGGYDTRYMDMKVSYPTGSEAAINVIDLNESAVYKVNINENLFTVNDSKDIERPF